VGRVVNLAAVAYPAAAQEQASHLSRQITGLSMKRIAGRKGKKKGVDAKLPTVRRLVILMTATRYILNENYTFSKTNR
jgi:hypothetical protein